jgi:hypothetical protein
MCGFGLVLVGEIFMDGCDINREGKERAKPQKYI